MARKAHGYVDCYHINFVLTVDQITLMRQLLQDACNSSKLGRKKYHNAYEIKYQLDGQTEPSEALP